MSFAPFLDHAPFPDEGTYRFQVGSDGLRSAAASVRLAAGSGKESVPLVRCVLRPGALKLSAYARGCFAEEWIEVDAVEGVGDEGVAFVLDLTTLSRIAAAFARGQLRITYDAGRRLLTVAEGSSRIELPGQTPTGLADYRDRLGLPSRVAAAPTELMRSALRYVSLFAPAQSDAAVANLAVTDLTYTVRGEAGRQARQGLAVGGSDRTMSLLLSDSLLGLDVGVPGGSRDFVLKALGRLEPGQTELYRTDAFFVLIDPRRLFGWDHPAKPFPTNLSQRHMRPPDDLIRLDRATLRRTLNRVGTVSDRSSLVQLAIAGSGEGAKLTVRITDPESGRLAEDTLSVLRAQAEGVMFGRPREAVIPLQVLTLLLAHFPDETVSIGLDEQTVRIYDKLPDATAISIVASQRPLAESKAA